MWAWPCNGPGQLPWLRCQARFMAGPLLPPGVQPRPRTFSTSLWRCWCAHAPGVRAAQQESLGGYKSPKVLLVQGLPSIHGQCYRMGTSRTGGNGAAPGEPAPLITMGETESSSPLFCLRLALALEAFSPGSLWPPVERSSSPQTAAEDQGLPVGGVAFSWGGSRGRKCAVMNALIAYDLRPQCFLTAK